MQVQQKSLTTAKSAKDYLSKNEIPQLFECLMTGLMYHRPTDYIDYLQECLEKIKKQGVNAVHWDMFLEAKRTPLPPIAPTPKEDFRPEPLPEIGSFQLKISPDSTIVIIQGGPGIGKSEFCYKLSVNFPEFVHIEMGKLIRERALMEARDSNSKWKGDVNIINEGNFASEDLVLDVLIKELNKNVDKKHFLIDGYPRTDLERKDFERLIGFNKLKFMVLIDCEEEVCQRYLQNKPNSNEWRDFTLNAISRKVANYKSNTLAVCKYIDDQKKLRVIDGDNDSESIYKEILSLFNKEIRGITSPVPASSFQDETVPDSITLRNEKAVDEIPELMGISTEAERNSDLPQCTIVLMLGGPGSGKTEIASYLCKKFPGLVHFDMNEILRNQILNSDSPNYQIAQRSDGFDENSHVVESLVIQIDEMKNLLKSVDENTQIIFIEGFPRNETELNQLNTEIGRISYVILLDSEEEVMKARLRERHSRLGSKEDEEANALLRIQYFKENGLPLCRYYDERCQLNILNSDQDTLYITDDIEKIILNSNNSAVEQQKHFPVENEEFEMDEEASAAAVTIQATIRGHLTRKRLKENRALENEKKMETENEIKSNDVNEDEKEQDLNVNEEDVNIITDNENNEEISEKVIESRKGTPLEENVEIEDAIAPAVAFLEGNKGVRTMSQMQLLDASIVLLLGGPGSGKKTLGDHLVIKYAVSFVHVDQLIKFEINSNSESADVLNQCIESNYADITPILSLLRKTLVQSMNVSKNIIVAGFPKTYEQYQLFVEDVAPVSAIVYLDVDPDTMQSRLEAEADPDFFVSAADQVRDFNEKNSLLLGELSKMEIFNRINGAGNTDEVLALATEVFEKFSFMGVEE